MPAEPVPRGFHTLTPFVVVRDAARAIEFYKQAFGAEEYFCMRGPDGKSILHAQLKIGDSMLMLGDESPHSEVKSPRSVGSSTGGIMLYVDDVDAVFNRAVGAGATVRQPVNDMFWGDRMGNLEDPFGHMWSIATHKEDLSQAEIENRAKVVFAKTATQ